METIGQEKKVWTDLWENSKIEVEIDMWDYYGLRPYILKYTPRFGDVLEAGCGLGKFNFYLSRLGINTIGLDFSKETILFLKEWQKKNGFNLPFVEGDIKQMPYEDNSLSGYLSFGVMEHFIEGPKEAMDEMYRALRPGGVAIITTPNNSWNVMRGSTKKRIKNTVKKILRKKIIRPPFFQYYYSPTKLKSLVEASEMKVTKHIGAAFLFTFTEFFGKNKSHNVSSNDIYNRIASRVDKSFLKTFGSQSITISVKIHEIMHCFLCGDRSAKLNSLDKYDVPICENCENESNSVHYLKDRIVSFKEEYSFNPRRLSVVEKRTCSFCTEEYNTDPLFEDFGFNKNVCPDCLKKPKINVSLSNENVKPIWRDRKTAEGLHEK